MSQLLALEWNNREVRMAVASGRDRQVVIEHAFTVAWNAEGADVDHPEQRIAAKITEELTARGIESREVLVAVSRSSIELRQLQLPPAPEADLPDMVRFQAVREFNELDEKWLLDFAPIDVAADGARTVLATAIAPAMIKEIETVCEKAELKMRRLLLRSCEAASLLADDRAVPPDQLRLLVDLLADEADLTAEADGKAIFLRTTRFSGDPPPVPAMLTEIRLTMAAVQNQLGGRIIQSIVLCGRDSMHADLVQAIESELGMHVQLFDPFIAVELGPLLKKSPPAHPGRFAPLLGMLVTELRPAGHAIDFLHPRRRPEAPSRRKKYILAAATFAALGLAYLTYSRIDTYLLAGEVDGLRAQSKALDDSIKRAKNDTDHAREVKKLVEGDVVWLDQLCGLSEGFPPKEDALMGDLSCGSQQGGTMDIKGWVRNLGVFQKMGESVRAHVGQIDVKTQKDDTAVRPYTVHFEAVVLANRAPAEAATSKKEQAAPAAAKGKSETAATAKEKTPTGPPAATTKEKGAAKDKAATKEKAAAKEKMEAPASKEKKPAEPAAAPKQGPPESPSAAKKEPAEASAPAKKEAKP